MKIGILSRGPQNHATRSLTEAALNAGHAAEILDPFGFYLHVGGTRNRITYHGKPVEDFDVIMPRLSRTTAQYGGEVVAHFEWISTPVINRRKTDCRSTTQIPLPTYPRTARLTHPTGASPSVPPHF